MTCSACTMTNNRHETKTYRCVRCSVVRWHYDTAPVYVLGVRLGAACIVGPCEPQEDRRSAQKASRKASSAPAVSAAPVTVSAAPITKDAN